MAPPQGTSFYPGILHPKSGAYTVLHGIDPGIITIDAAHQNASPSLYGDVTIRYGSSSIVLKDCRLESAEARRTTLGNVTSFRLMDRRWKWRFGEIYGHYNPREKSHTLNTRFRATPQELAYLLLQAMGEQGYDISQLPNGVQGPEVQWDGANPAQELLKLANQFGCRVVFNPLTNRVSIQKTGNGQSLPQRLSIESPSATLSSPGGPSAIRFLCGPTRFQWPIRLEAVGMDTDGSVKAINNLSYTPSGGWGKENFLFASLTSEKEKELAYATVFRWYRVAPNMKIPQYPSGLIEVRDGFMIYNMSHNLNTTEVTATNGVTPEQAYVEGVFWVRNIGAPINSPKQREGNNNRLAEDFRIISDLNIVEFSRQVKKWDESSEEWKPADLWVTCGFNLRDRFTAATHRHSYLYQFNQQSNTKPEIVTREDVVLKVTDGGSPGSFTGGRWTSNLLKDQIREQAEFYAIQASKKYLLGASGDLTYQEIVPVHVDGKIQSVSWQWDDAQGATTRASMNTEPDIVETKYEARAKFTRMMQELKIT